MALKKPVDIVTASFAPGQTEPSKNYVIYDPPAISKERPALILGNNGKLYVRKDLVPDGATEMRVVVTAVK